MSFTYLTTDELSKRIKHNPRTIRNVLKDSVLFEGRHYVRPFGGRKTKRPAHTNRSALMVT
ncbi:MAG: hypothetical protein ACOZAI_02665 [Pseudomonadota bacterium]